MRREAVPKGDSDPSESSVFAMPSKFELECAVRFSRIAGLRIYGQFDHDATRITGPNRSYRYSVLADTLRKSRLNLSSEQSAPLSIQIERFEDERTGEMLHRPVHSQ